MKTQLLCTFTKKNRLDDTIDDITSHYDIAFEKIYVLQNKDNRRELMCTYNIFTDGVSGNLDNTISIHRKKNSNTLYTINALNHIVAMKTGQPDPNYSIDWDDYRNCLLVTDEDGLKKIPTKIFDIVEL